jgi:hypothetical protein
MESLEARVAFFQKGEWSSNVSRERDALNIVIHKYKIQQQNMFYPDKNTRGHMPHENNVATQSLTLW